MRLEGVENQTSCRPQPHHRFDQIDRTAVDALLCDRIATDDEREHVVARNQARVILDEVERKADHIADDIDHRAHRPADGADPLLGPVQQVLRPLRRALPHRRWLTAHHRRGHTVRFALAAVAGVRAAHVLHGGRALLLHHVRDLVRHECEIVGAFAGSEKDVRTERKGPRATRSHERLGARSLMHPHGREVDAETSLEWCAHGNRQGGAGLACEEVAHTRWGASHRRAAQRIETEERGARWCCRRGAARRARCRSGGLRRCRPSRGRRRRLGGSRGHCYRAPLRTRSGDIAPCRRYSRSIAASRCRVVSGVSLSTARSEA